MTEPAGTRRLAILVEYQGTAYVGSQLQANGPTIQGALERALGSLTGESIKVALAGRTDAGVHAKGQVASFCTASGLSIESFSRGTNALLPLDVSVRAAVEAPVDFDPRRHARSRWYRYTIHRASERSALMRDFVWHHSASLDLDAMAESALSLIGRHDFAAFTQPSQTLARRTEREVTRADVQRRGELAVFNIEANAFLPQMVRRIVGSLTEVGSGKMSLPRFEELVREGRPGAAAFVAPPQGLCLMKVRYDSSLFD